jgi:hypothetical protein
VTSLRAEELGDGYAVRVSGAGLSVVESRVGGYAAHELAVLGGQGKAFPNPDGHWSYPTANRQDLVNAIKAVGRSGASHNAVRKYLIGRASAMKLSFLIPSNWASDGSLRVPVRRSTFLSAVDVEARIMLSTGRVPSRMAVGSALSASTGAAPPTSTLTSNERRARRLIAETAPEPSGRTSVSSSTSSPTSGSRGAYASATGSPQACRITAPR